VVIDHFRYPTGRSDFRDYQAKTERMQVGMPLGAFQDLWSNDDVGYRLLGRETMQGEAGPTYRYFIGYDIEYMEAPGRDVDCERRGPVPPDEATAGEKAAEAEAEAAGGGRAPRDEHEWDRFLHENRARLDFWKSYHITMIVTCAGERVTHIEPVDERIAPSRARRE
jgi:hypothetical protein